jgi:hypothetical protein
LGVPTKLSLPGVPILVGETPKQVMVCAIAAGKVVGLSIHTVDESYYAVAVAIPNIRLLLVVEINFIFYLSEPVYYIMNLRGKSKNSGLSHVNTQ